jgi:hypothetical protein
MSAILQGMAIVFPVALLKICRAVVYAPVDGRPTTICAPFFMPNMTILKKPPQVDAPRCLPSTAQHHENNGTLLMDAVR